MRPASPRREQRRRKRKVNVRALTDEQLFAELRRAWPDRPGYGDLMAEVRRRQGKRVQAVTRRVLWRFPYVAEDAEQEAWKKFHTELNTARVGFEAGLLLTVAKTVSIDQRRSETAKGGWGTTRGVRGLPHDIAPHQRVPADQDAAGADSARITRIDVSEFDEHHLPPSRNTNPEEVGRVRELMKLLADCASRLTDWRWAHAVYRLFAMGDSQDEVARAFGVTTRTVRNWLHGETERQGTQPRPGAIELLRRCLETRGVTDVEAVFDGR
jgi:DNA-directed RNA polymerase specialized sigma24 family protein